MSERHAYTFQHLSAKAAEVFYPEANELVENDKRKCDSIKENSDVKSEF
ncbi:MAG: hypothetical protein ACK5Z5_07340 [Neisseriaceae bacterium]